MKAYKGFNPGLVCKDKQYQENTVFEEPDLCNKIQDIGLCEKYEACDQGCRMAYLRSPVEEVDGNG